MMISLPAKWIKQFNLNKGDEIELNEQEGKIILSTDKEYGLKKEIVEITNKDIANRVILNAYINGIDELEIKFSDPKLIDKIQKEILSGLIGFEIISQKEGKCIIRQISKPTEEEFDNVLKKIFSLLSSMNEELINSKEKIHIKAMDFNVNKFVSFCLRILNKYKREHKLYTMIVELEWLGDVYKHIADCKLNEEEQIYLKKINEFFNDFQNEFYNRKNPLEVLSKHKKVLLKDIKPTNESIYLKSAAFTIIRLFGTII